MRATRRSTPRGECPRRGAVVVEMAIIMPLLMLLILGGIDFGRFMYTYIAVTHAAQAGAEVAIMYAYPDPDPSTRTGLSNWQLRICKAVADDLVDLDPNMATYNFAPVGSSDPNAYTNSHGLYVSAFRYGETGGLWRAQITVRYTWFTWGFFHDFLGLDYVKPEQTVVFRAIR